MFDSEDYRYAVLEILSQSHRRDMCNLRIELFMAAAGSRNAEACLMPFPSCFFDRKSQTKNIAGLQEQIKHIPKLLNISEESDLPAISWELLYWIFTNPLTIEKVPNTKKTLTDWTEQTGLGFISNAATLLNKLPSSAQLYTVVTPRPRQAFIIGKEAHGTKFAFHGSKLENFHSIIHRGLVSALNMRSAYGVGSYLSSRFHISRDYITGPEADCVWKNSASPHPCGMKCMAICEFVNDPSITVKELNVSTGFEVTYYVIAKDDLIQLSHLILL